MYAGIVGLSLLHNVGRVSGPEEEAERSESEGLALGGSKKLMFFWRGFFC